MSFDALIDDLLSLSHAKTSAAKTATALELVLNGDVDSLRLLLQDERSAKRDLHVNARHPHSGRSLLHEACAEGHLDIVKFLLEKTDADLMLRTMLGRSTPLHLAVTCSHRAVVFLLLSYGADALSRDRFGCSPMHYVKSLSVAKLLIQYGGQVLDYNSKRRNALESVLIFAESGNVEDELARRTFQNFLNHQAETEYKSKLDKLKQLKKQQRKQLKDHHHHGGKSPSNRSKLRKKLAQV